MDVWKKCFELNKKEKEKMFGDLINSKIELYNIS